jgi:hypothetical protein
MRSLHQRLLRQERERYDPKHPPIEVRAAVKRMEARVEIRWIEFERAWRDFLQSEYEHPTVPPPVTEPPVTPPDEEARYERARALIGENSPAAEARDQELIRRWELRCYGLPGPLTERWSGDWWGKSWPKLSPEEVEALKQRAEQVVAAYPVG